MSTTFDNVIEQIKARESEEKCRASMAGPSLLTYPEKIDSGRLIMFNSHIIQRVVLNQTEMPKVFGNYENIVGDNSSFNNRAKTNMKLLKVIHKFPKIKESLDFQKAFFFVYDEDREMYDVIERNDVEDLTEKYGFQYDNSGINSYKVGDTIKQGDTLFRPTSYDEFGNYGFGKNVKSMYLVDLDTLEDAIVISESLAKSMESTEIERVKVPINDNDFLLNLYGDNDHYKSFPDIGEHTKDKILCIKRRIINSQILFDLKSSNTKKQLGSDIPKYVSGEIVDIDIYCNKPLEDIPRTVFNEQLIDYIEMTNAFWTEIKEYTQELLDSGVECSQKIKYFHKRATELTDPDYVVKDEGNNEFGNIVMYFTVKRKIGLGKGQKLTGRYGNKGVVSKIYPDYMMPHLENGETVHIIFNTLGVYNRLNIFQLFEQSINFVTNRVVEKFKKDNLSISEMEKILFRILEIFNPEQRDKMQATYKETCKKKADKEEFFNIVKEYGIHIHIEPFWHSENLYTALQTVYKEFDWIKPYNVYFYEPVSSRWVKMMNQQVVGDLYVMKLKQNSKKQLSVCSYAPIGRTGMPEKTDNAKKHKSPVAPTPIKKGIQESTNTMISIQPETYAKQHMFYRSSPVAGRELGYNIIDNYGAGKEIEPRLTDKMSARNIEILNAYLLIMGYELESSSDMLNLPQLFGEDYDNNNKLEHRLNGVKYIASPDYMMKEYAKERARQKMESNELGYFYIGEDGMYKDQFLEELADNIVAEMKDNGLDFFKSVDNENL